MQRKNTLQHWTLLSVARYYDNHGTACRVRDIYATANGIFDNADQIARTVHRLKQKGLVDHVSVESSTAGGHTVKAFAYYPNEDGIKALTGVGEPTQLPDGRPVPDEANTAIPESYVRPGDDIEPPRDDVPAPTYSNTWLQNADDDGTKRAYDASDRRRPADFSLDEELTPVLPKFVDTPKTEDDDTTDMDEETETCKYCGETFKNASGRGVHEKYELDRIHEQALDEREREKQTHTCTYCGETFDTAQGRGVHEKFELDRIHEQALDERDEQRDTDYVEPETETIDPATTADPVGDFGLETPTAGDHAGAVDWPRIATRLERKAMDAADAGLTEIASAYSQYATLAVEGNLDKRIAFIALGTPVLELEDEAATAHL